MDSQPLSKLDESLSNLPPGSIDDDSDVVGLLIDAWETLDGSCEQNTTAEKLLGRIEGLAWEPPILKFTIERHGGTVLGSSRAELHDWEVDVKRGTACLSKIRYRQLRKRQPAVDVDPIAEELVQAILQHTDDDRICWLKSGDAKISMGKVFPSNDAAKQTVAGRRKRLRLRLEELLRAPGWTMIRANVYHPP